MILNRDFKSISCRRQSQKFHKEKNKPINNNRFHNTMKKSFMILAVLAMSALAMVSCKKDKDTDNGEKITIYATMDSPKAGGERTHLGPTTNNFTPTYWSTNDEVAVFSGSQMKEFKLTGGENTPDATFAGEAPTAKSAYCAFYPYSGPNNLSATQSGSTYTVTYALPYCQTYRAPVNGNPTFDDQYCPMIAYSTDGQNYQFKNMMGVLKLDLKGTGTVSYIVLKDNNTNAKLHGTATVSVSAPGATPSLTSASFTDGRNDLKLTCGTGVELNENTATSFYFVVPVGTLGTKGFIIDVYNANDEYYRIDKSNISGNIIQRAIISTLAVDNVEVPEVTPTGALSGKFSVAEGKQVYFSQGNLQYVKNENKWQFATTQYETVETDDQDVGENYANQNVVSLFGWGTSGKNQESDLNYINYQPWATAAENIVSEDYNVYGYGPSNNVSPDYLSVDAGSDWGANAISNGGNLPKLWRTLTKDEWTYLVDTRKINGETGYGHTYIDATVNDVFGVIIFHDDYDGSTTGLTSIPEGCLFLPAAGERYGKGAQEVGMSGTYWSSSPTDYTGTATLLSFMGMPGFFVRLESARDASRYYGFSVRLVRNAN